MSGSSTQLAGFGAVYRRLRAAAERARLCRGAKPWRSTFYGLDGHIERLPAAWKSWSRRKVDVIVTAGQEADAARRRNRPPATIPIVMLAVDYDPSRSGYVAEPRPAGGQHHRGLPQSTRADRQASRTAQRDGARHARVIVLSDAIWSRPVRSARRAAAQSLQLPIKSVELRDPPYDYAESLGGCANLGPATRSSFSTSPSLSRPRSPCRARAAASAAVDVRQREITRRRAD